jgi:hypothetical protein
MVLSPLLQFRDQGVGGSNPLSPTIYFQADAVFSGIAKNPDVDDFVAVKASKINNCISERVVSVATRQQSRKTQHGEISDMAAWLRAQDEARLSQARCGASPVFQPLPGGGVL